MAVRAYPAHKVPRSCIDDADFFFPAPPRLSAQDSLAAHQRKLLPLWFSQGGANTIKEQQKLFQAQKKVTGNTHTARGMPLNLFAFFVITVGGSLMMSSTLRKLYYGVGKIELKD